MADPKGTDFKPNETKPAETRSAAVKPPVLDMKARQAGSETAETKAAPTAKPETKPTPDRPKTPPVAEPTQPGFAFGAALTGGIVGLAAAYGLAWFGLWPTTPVPAPVTDPRLAQFATAIPELETVTQTTQSELATLTRRIGALETTTATPVATSQPPAPDTSAIAADLAALGARIDALSNTPAPVADTTALSSELATLTAQMQEISARVGTAEAELRNLDSTVAQTTAALAEQPNDIGAVLQLPLILSGFESAFATGRPFEAELGALRAAVPDASVPTAIANAATTGLTRPDVIARRFESVLPAMLAGRPADPDAQWQDGALDWFRSAIALRPTGEIAGDTPEALMSQLEAAMARRDFTAAETLLAALPDTMIAAAEDIPALVATQAEATRFLDALRSQALNGEAGQ